MFLSFKKVKFKIIQRWKKYFVGNYIRKIDFEIMSVIW